jgi:hypothetical protein
MLLWLVGWWNWIFLLAIAVVGAFVLLDLLLGGLLEFFDVDIDLDIDADGDLDADVDFSGHGIVVSCLMWLGVGKIPLTNVLQTLMITYGSIGLLVNSVWSIIVPLSLAGLSFPFALGAATIGSIPLTKIIVDKIAPYMPSDSTITREEGD